MNDDCEMPPSFSFELPVLGPFTAKECLLLGALLIPGLPLFRISFALAFAIMSTNSFLALVFVLEGRRGKHPFRFFLIFLTRHFSVLQKRVTRSSPPQPASDTMEMYSIEALNYVCAVESERESVLSSFLRLCSDAEGGLRLISVPLRLNGLEARSDLLFIFDGELAGATGMRSFYLTLKEDRSQIGALGSAQLKKVRREDPPSSGSLLSPEISGPNALWGTAL